MMHGDSAYVCNLSNTTGMQLLQCIFLWAWHCFRVDAVEPRAWSRPAERRGRLRAQQPRGVVAGRGDIGGRFIDSG